MLSAEAPPPVDPYAIFSQTRAAVTAARYPSRLDYTIQVSGYDGSVLESNHYHASNRVDNVIDVASISDEEKAAPPPVPHGINVDFVLSLCKWGCGGLAFPVGRRPPPFDLLGVPMLTPEYMFGLKYPAVRLATTHASPDPASIPVIAVVSSQKRDYAIEYAGAQTVDGVRTDDLRFTPLRDPKNNRLRELWTGKLDHLPRRAAVAGNFTVAPLTDVPWIIDFTIRDGVPYIANEVADATLYMSHRKVVRNAQIAFDDIREGDGFMNSPLVAPDRTDTSLVEPGQ